MKKTLFAGIAAAAVMGASLGSAGMALASANPSQDASTVINQLQADGYRVIISKSGGGDMSKCTVKSINRQSPVKDVQAGRDNQNRPTTIPNAGYKVAYVVLAC